MGGRLTKRQVEVLHLVAAGLTDRQIAERLCISHRTAGTHVQDALVALDAATRAHAVYLHFVVGAAKTGRRAGGENR